jgi:hypothetical protein
MKWKLVVLTLILAVALLGVVMVMAAPPNPGDLIINEVMQNPSNVTDAYGEWFELYNTSSVTVDLDGCVAMDLDTDSFTFTQSMTYSTQIAPGQYYLACNDGDLADNGGLDCDYSWAPYAQMYLGNSADELIIKCGEDEIDRIEWDGGTNWPDPSGASMQYGVPNSGDTSNNIGANWAETTTSTYVTGDYGTPGACNDDWMGTTVVTFASFDALASAPWIKLALAASLAAVLVLLRRKR